MTQNLFQRPRLNEMTYQQSRSTYVPKDYSKCDVCGTNLDADRMHIMVDNGNIIRNVYCCRKHRYVEVEFNGKLFTQERTDREIEYLATQFRAGQLELEWE